MSLQVCHCCGWSKVTSYQGLRIHQGRMGCTAPGMRIAETEQQNLWGFAGYADVKMDLKLDVSVKTESRDYHSDVSLQICHCGWTNMTTYQGLRIHQGKKGCTPKGERIPKTEQYIWKDFWKEEEDYKQHPPTKRGVKKQESLPEPPRMVSFTSSTAATATIKEEFKSPSAVSPRFYKQSKSGCQREEHSTIQQVNRPVRGRSTAANQSRVQATKKKIPSQIVPQNTLDSGGGEDDRSTERLLNFKTTARIKEEPKSPCSRPEVSVQTSMSRSVKPVEEILDLCSDKQAKEFYSGDPWVTSTAQRDRKRPTSSQAKLLVREDPQITHPETDVRPKEKHQVSRMVMEPPAVVSSRKDSLLLTAKDGQKSQLLREIQNRLQEIKKKRKEEMRDVRPVETTCENLVGSPRSSPIAAAALEENKSSFTNLRNSLKTPTNPNAAAAEQTNCPVSNLSEHSKAPHVVPLKKKGVLSLLVNPEIGNQKSDELTAPTARDLHFNQRTLGEEKLKKRNRKHRAASPVVPPQRKSSLFKSKPENAKSVSEAGVRTNCERTSDASNTEHQSASPTAEIPPKEDQTPPFEDVQPGSSGMKVKELARMFSVNTSRDKAAQPKEKPGEEHKPSQVKVFARRFSAIQTQETADHPKEEHKENHGPTVSTTNTSRKASAAEAPTSHESDSSTGMKVKELARMFSVQEPAAQLTENPGHTEKPKLSQVKLLAQRFLRSTSEETAIRPKTENRVEQKLTQKIKEAESVDTKLNPGASRATTIDNHKSSHKATQLPSVSSSLKVKDLARMFSAKTFQDKTICQKEE